MFAPFTIIIMSYEIIYDFARLKPDHFIEDQTLISLNAAFGSSYLTTFLPESHWLRFAFTPVTVTAGILYMHYSLKAAKPKSMIYILFNYTILDLYI